MVRILCAIALLLILAQNETIINIHVSQLKREQFELSIARRTDVQQYRYEEITNELESIERGRRNPLRSLSGSPWISHVWNWASDTQERSRIWIADWLESETGKSK